MLKKCLKLVPFWSVPCCLPSKTALPNHLFAKTKKTGKNFTAPSTVNKRCDHAQDHLQQGYTSLPSLFKPSTIDHKASRKQYPDAYT